MEEIKKWELINSAETFDDLKEAILQLGTVQGRAKPWDVDHMLKAIDKIIAFGGYPHTYRMLTRSYGIRQQMMYIMTYTKFEQPKDDNPITPLIKILPIQ